MSNTTDRAWLFELPAGAISSDPEAIGRGLTLNATGGVAMAEGNRAVRQSILILLSTRPGERVMRPDYGCWLHRLAFAPNDASTAGLASHFVREALRRWEPRVIIQRLEAGPNLHGEGDESVLDIVLDYHVRHSGLNDQLALTYDLNRSQLLPPASALSQGDSIL